MTRVEKLAFIGAGSMTEAIICGILKKGFIRPENIFVTNKDNRKRLERLATQYNVRCSNDKKETVKDANTIILAVKPKDAKVAMAAIAPYIDVDQRLISVVAGVSSDFISRVMEKPVAVIRAMPNTSAAVGKSATAIAPGKYASSEDLQWAKRLFETIGSVVIVSEDRLHAVTGLSGSGPAYIYYLVESMEKAAKDIGLDTAVARDLVIQTLLGSAEMLKSTKMDAQTLRKQVTSPGGTTQAGLEVLRKFNYQEALIACIRRATERSMELGQAYENDTVT
ncbi:pyrroline-5-carboxylate reductase [Tuberibacillus calidus]|uniref:pyrroline-5-carboxylate reductase n=1 Tax=Tuberibacillus calidus TaxID=340097 RepID=UPI003CCC34F1